MSDTPFDLVVFGASSFVGSILTRYLWAHCGDDFAWAVAGRSRDKLQELRNSLGGDAHQLPILTADSHDSHSLQALCAQTRLVVSTVGPYALHGEELVRACAETGTDYCDLTGEVQWMHRMIERYQSWARDSGARLVQACGFDSVPSDLGVYFCQEKARERWGAYCQQIKMRVRKMRGGLSGGTVASMINVTREAMSNPDLRRLLGNSYALCPPDHGYWVRQHQPQVEYDKDLHSWTAPFFMSAINTRIVFRSNALQNSPYGKDFRYDEASLAGDGTRGKWRARALQGGTGLFGLGVALPPSRWLLEKTVLPKPGEGPSPKAQAEGFWELDFIGRLPDGSKIHTSVTGDRDPGYGSTAKMLGQAALCLTLATDREKLPGGFWTPASAMNGRLIERLENYAGLAFKVIS